ncbi:MAG: alpha/beta fold hydrolase [Dehalococcoidia bacterium]|nr:alpha/beta fold hydrolase [Dehalococcoidia bacterium]
MPRLELDGFRLYYEVHGSGPAVVLLHGAGGNHLSWWQQLPELSRSYTCIILSQRAFGLSPDSEDGPGRRAFAGDLVGLLDHLGIERVALVAHSMGGRTAAGFTLRLAPGRTWALVLSGTHGGVLTDESRGIQEGLRGRMDGRPLLQRALGAGFAERHPDLALLYRQINRVNPPRPADFLAPIPGYIGSTREGFNESGMPILYVVGAEDEVVDPEVIRIAAAALDRAELAVIDAAGHSTYFEQPREFNRIILDFLDRHRPQGEQAAPAARKRGRVT